MQKPIKRSKLRLFLGKIFYNIKRQLYWHSPFVKFAHKINKKQLPNQIFTHKSILRRKLKNVDMWMQENKITNLKIAINNLNGLVIKPGEVFSYWQLIGNPTKKKGYVDGMILRDGKMLSGVGGGLCQLSNLIYWMTLHTPLHVTERWRHGYDVFTDVNRKQPFGSGSTCAYPNIDLQIKNCSNQNYQLQLEIKDEYLVGKWLAEKFLKIKYKIIEKDHLIKHEFWGGYTRNNKIFRQIIDKATNKILNEKCITQNHAIMMYNPLIDKSSSHE